MTTIYKDIPLEASMEQVWAAIRDVGAVHRRLATGFVVDCHRDGNARVVTFANGMVARELIVGIDDQHRRVAYSVVEGQATHHNASMQIFANGEGRSRLVWITDVLPDEVAGPLAEMIEQGSAVMKQTLERGNLSDSCGLGGDMPGERGHECLEAGHLRKATTITGG